jgi:hypothetical protein
VGGAYIRGAEEEETRQAVAVRRRSRLGDIVETQKHIRTPARRPFRRARMRPAIDTAGALVLFSTGSLLLAVVASHSAYTSLSSFQSGSKQTCLHARNA